MTTYCPWASRFIILSSFFPLSRLLSLLSFPPLFSSPLTFPSKESAKSYSKPIKELKALRKSATDASRNFVGCATLKKNYAQLILVQSRFPMKEGEPAAVTFAWDDSSQLRKVFSFFSFQMGYNV